MAFAPTPTSSRSAGSRRRTEVIGHRGSPRAYTENTIPSFVCALESGVDGIELDVHATADGVVVVHHDPRLDVSHPGRREPGPAIVGLTFDELGEYGRSRGEPIPTLTEVLAVVDGRARTYVEIKAPAIEALVVEVIRASGSPCSVHSFDHRIARRIHELDPELPTGILLTSYLIEPERALEAAGARDLWQHWEMIDDALVDLAHAHHARVVAWTVNDLDIARKLAAMGVDGICTDLPAEMVRVLAT